MNNVFIELQERLGLSADFFELAPGAEHATVLLVTRGEQPIFDNLAYSCDPEMVHLRRETKAWLLDPIRFSSDLSDAFDEPDFKLSVSAALSGGNPLNVRYRRGFRSNFYRDSRHPCNSRTEAVLDLIKQMEHLRGEEDYILSLLVYIRRCNHATH